MLQQNEIGEAVKLCAAAANNDGKNKVAIYTYGIGIEIVSGEFKTDRNYYHDATGNKSFFTPICFAEPNGHITMLN